MKFRMLQGASIVLLAAGLAVTGCAKKTGPAPPPAPPVSQSQEQPPVPTPTPQPQETPAPAPTHLGSDDFQPVFFDLDAYTLRDDARAALDKNAKLLRDNSGVQITIEGHCDERGTAEYNQALGERRAMAAREYLTAAGISAARLQIVSYGKERPFSSGHDEASWQQNRRAHFTIRS